MHYKGYIYNPDTNGLHLLHFYKKWLKNILTFKIKICKIDLDIMATSV